MPSNNSHLNGFYSTILTSLLFSLSTSVFAAPTTEWTFHKTADGTHPNGHEQQAMWLMNRARSNPTQEGLWLASSTDPDVANGRSFFSVDTNVLKNEFAALTAKPPAAFDVRLYNAAFTHSSDLIARDAQDHNNQFPQILNAGFSYTSARGSVFAYAGSGLNAHAAWNIDWGGSDGTGMQTGRGHRQATMSIDGNYTNTGIAMIYETNSSTLVGPYVTTANYCYANTGAANHFNRFIVGTVWQDNNSNGLYDPGEGVSSVKVSTDSGTYFAVTGDAGGYAIPVANGRYTVTFSGNSLTGNYIKNININSSSELLDIEIGIDQPTADDNFLLDVMIPVLQAIKARKAQI